VDGTLSPASPGANDLHLRVVSGSEPRDQRPSLRLTATMPGMAMRPTVSVLHPTGQGYQGAVWLPMFGSYRLTMTLIGIPHPESGTHVVALPFPQHDAKRR
jgi:hypothetical protein